LSSYSVSQTTGALTTLGNPLPVGIFPTTFALGPEGRFLYVADLNGALVYIFAVNASTGALTAAGTVPVPGGKPLGITIHPSGKFVLVGNESTNLSVFTINSVSGALAPVAGGTFPAAGNAGSSIAMTSSGKHVYVASSRLGDVFTYSFNSDTGVPSLVGSPVNIGSALNAWVSVSGAFAYVTNDIKATLNIYAIDAASGALTKAGPTLTTGVQPARVFFDPTNRFAYVPNTLDGNVAVYTINATTGALATTAGSPYKIATQSDPNTVVFGP
jgi:6-phosphogluconolactonase